MIDEAHLDEVLRALSHAQRRRFVRLCMSQERSAGELAEQSDLGLASVSEHLKVLRKCGLLVLEVRGRHWMYRTDSRFLQATTQAVKRLSEGIDGP